MNKLKKIIKSYKKCIGKDNLYKQLKKKLVQLKGGVAYWYITDIFSDDAFYPDLLFDKSKFITLLNEIKERNGNVTTVIKPFEKRDDIEYISGVIDYITEKINSRKVKNKMECLDVLLRNMPYKPSLSIVFSKAIQYMLKTGETIDKITSFIVNILITAYTDLDEEELTILTEVDYEDDTVTYKKLSDTFNSIEILEPTDDENTHQLYSDSSIFNKYLYTLYHISKQYDKRKRSYLERKKSSLKENFFINVLSKLHEDFTINLDRQTPYYVIKAYMYLLDTMIQEYSKTEIINLYASLPFFKPAYRLKTYIYNLSIKYLKILLDIYRKLSHKYINSMIINETEELIKHLHKRTNNEDKEKHFLLEKFLKDIINIYHRKMKEKINI